MEHLYFSHLCRVAAHLCHTWMEPKGNQLDLYSGCFHVIQIHLSDGSFDLFDIAREEGTNHRFNELFSRFLLAIPTSKSIPIHTTKHQEFKTLFHSSTHSLSVPIPAQHAGCTRTSFNLRNDPREIHDGQLDSNLSVFDGIWWVDLSLKYLSKHRGLIPRAMVEAMKPDEQF